jgi:alkanesulfonate monooxygenase SsuD/methylene tetrahydromethanopterin reductase-like flavin-dependent oxidoreductase (luciferase family)
VTSIGAALPHVAHRDLVASGRALDELRFDELWLVEDCFEYGGVSAAAAILASTERVGVGVGLFPVAVRNPAILAMELATIAELFPGRMTAGVGHGVESWMRQIDARPRDRLVALRELLITVHGLLAGETASIDGGWAHLEDVVLAQPPAVPPPLVVGTTGARGISIAAEHADGLLLCEGSGPAAVRWARARLGPDPRLVVYAWLRIEDSVSQALEALTPWVDRWEQIGRYPQLLELARSEPGYDGALAPVLALAGPAAACAEGVQRLAEAGADAVVLSPVGDDPPAQLRRFANEALALLRAERPA